MFRPAVEGEITVSSVHNHDTLAFTVCNEILSAPDSFQTKVFRIWFIFMYKTLKDIFADDYPSILELTWQ